MQRRGRRLNLVLFAIVALEALALWAVVLRAIAGLVADGAESLSTGIALTALAAIAALWLSATAVAVARRQRWSRGSVITWQVLQVAVAVGLLQGSGSTLAQMAVLAVPAVAAIVLVLLRSVRAVYGIEE